MCYRVLVPWVVRQLERATRLPRIGIYHTVKTACDALAFFAVGAAFGIPVMLLSVVLLLLTVKYDYWDWAMEMAGVCLAATGNLELASLGVFVHSLSRETVWVTPAAYLLKTGDWFGSAILLSAAGMYWVFLHFVIVGKRPLYCERWQVHYNLALFRSFRDPAFWRWGQFYHTDIWIACTLSLGVLISIFVIHTWLMAIPLVLLVAGWTLAKADETRVFSACIPWIALMLVGGVR
jgi:hypothetical protein